MSLLLDALKKAADDKKKNSQGVQVEAGSVDETAVVTADTIQQDQNAPSLQPTEPELSESAQSEDELTLDVIEPEPVEAAGADHKTTESIPVSGSQQGGSNRVEQVYTVSDDALSMLIHKTNHDVKHDKRIFLISILLISITVLTAGGVYHYLDMQAEIATLERKHQIAMQSMKSKTSGGNTPEKSKIIRKLTGQSDLDEKVKYAKQQIADKNNSQRTVRRPAVIADKGKRKTASSAVSFQKTSKADPVAIKLEAAWSAYNGGDLARSKSLYKEVLSIEKNNRDALLGLGAIAVIEKNNAAARNIYISLIKLDPRDPIAVAALASLQNTESYTELDEKHLQNMLQKNPGDAHLNFALGNIYAQQNNWKSAQQSYFNAWQRDNENADYIFNLAVSLDQLGKQQQAVDLYRDCLDKSTDRQVTFSREAVQKRISEIMDL